MVTNHWMLLKLIFFLLLGPSEPLKALFLRSVTSTAPTETSAVGVHYICGVHVQTKTNKNLRCGNRKGLLGRNDQTHHRMGPKTMESIPPSKRNTQADIQLRTRQTNHQQETDGCIQIKHNPEHQPSRMSSKSTAYVPPKTASTPTKANTQTCSYLDFNQFLIRRITRNICLRLRIKQIQILTCREQDIR